MCALWFLVQAMSSLEAAMVHGSFTITGLGNRVRGLPSRPWKTRKEADTLVGIGTLGWKLRFLLNKGRYVICLHYNYVVVIDKRVYNCYGNCFLHCSLDIRDMKSPNDGFRRHTSFHLRQVAKILWLHWPPWTIKQTCNITFWRKFHFS